MINQFINDIGGIGVFGTISICLFFIVFSGAIVFALSRKKGAMNAMSTLPLEDSQSFARRGNDSHE